MNLCQFNNVLYKGNINVDFYFFCLKKNKKLIKFLFVNIWYLMLSYLFNSKKDIYSKRQFRYLKLMGDLDEILVDFYNSKNKGNFFDIKPNIIVDRVPKILIANKFKRKRIVGFELDSNYDVDLEKFNKEISSIKKVKNIYLANKYSLNSICSDNSFVVHNNKMKLLKKRKKFNDKVLQFLCLIFLSLVITCFSFAFTNSYVDIDMFWSYFEIHLFILNWLPVFFVMLLLFLIIKRIHISWGVSSLIILVWGVVNQTKVFYRDDVVKFEDLGLVKEALIMTQRCDVVIKWYAVVGLIFIILIFFITRRKIEKLSVKFVKRFCLIILLLVLVFFGYKNIYRNKSIYDSVGDTNLINVWIATRQSQIRGLIYPFIYTLEDGMFNPPDDYDEKIAKKILSEYDYQDIPRDKKVNIIAIMLEAYNDFSKFDKIDFEEDIYKDLHDIQNNSISGNLVTNIFGGGTVTTERNFLTGYTDFNNFRKKTNSYVWYFKEQGYRVEAMHPIYGAFYNRASVNINLGFDVYYNYDNKFSKVQSNFLSDDLFFDYIIEGYENSKKDNVPYFNFSVTYQNHCPYSTDYYEGKEYYFDNNGYDVSLYNMVNQYFSGIKKTNEALKDLVEYFDNEEEPVIVVFFGDHNPSLGDNGAVYHELGINISFDTVEGFLNYYEIPYVIHANDVAKEMFDNSFVGYGDTISPVFLMNELFENMKLKGNEYLQYMNDLKEKVDVINPYYYKEDDEFVLIADSKYVDLVERYSWINYYQENN